MMEDVESMANWAMEIAEGLPEKYQQVAFAELLRHVLKSRPNPTENDTEVPSRAGYSQPTTPWLERLVSELPHDYHIAEAGTRDQQTVWAVIKLCEQGDEATSESVCEIIRASLGVTPPSPKNASGSLRRLIPKYLRREKRKNGQGYAYVPEAEALEILEGLKEGPEE